MKKIIDGKTYNTETADYLGDFQNSWRGDFHYYVEELYRTRKGTFFIYGKGNAASPYCEYYPLSKDYGPGSKIVVLTESEAQRWVERHLSSDDYCSIFGEPEEG